MQHHIYTQPQYLYQLTSRAAPFRSLPFLRLIKVSSSGAIELKVENRFENVSFFALLLAAFHAFHAFGPEIFLFFFAPL